MKIVLSSILIVCLSSLLLFQGCSRVLDFPEERTNEKDLYPKPLNAHVAEINPPGFSWLPINTADSYRLRVINVNTNEVVMDVDGIQDNVYVPRKNFSPTEYKWTVEAYNKKGDIIAKRRPYSLTIPEDLIKQPFPDVQSLLASIPKKHPRLIFTREQLPDIRGTLTNSRKDAWQRLINTADAFLNMPAPSLPTYEKYDSEKEYVLRRLEYKHYYRGLREAIDKALQSLSLAWLMTREEKYAVAAKRILLEVATWDPKGISSVKHSGFDEVGLSLARCTHRAYDWLYDALTEEERALVRQNCIERARDTFERVGIRRPFHRRPGSSHDGRLIAYLGEQAIVLKGEAPDEEVQRWLDYSLTAFMTVFPHWGGRDGGWAEGMDYGPRYNMFYTPWVEALRAVSDIDLWQRPFMRKVRNFFIYCTRPNAERKPFGDGAEIGLLKPSRHTAGLAAFLNLHAERFNDTICRWWAEQLPLPETYEYYPVVPLIPEISKESISLPQDMPQAACFKGVGWCAMHSDMADLDKDIFLLFKSSPYGTVSHSHGDQNAFHISVGGRALAIASGYYGPVYGMPHHAKWTRSTKANNAILVNEEGQVIRDFTATGRIAAYENGKSITYAAGAAAPAYKGLLNRCDRHILFVRPGLFVMLDDLEAPEKSNFQWMFHALDKIDMDESTQSLISRHKGAWLDIRLFNSRNVPLTFFQTEQFDTPYYEGVPEIYKEKMTDYWHETYKKDVIDQWHFTASSSELLNNLRIATIMHAGVGEGVDQIDWLTAEGWQGARIHYPDGDAEVWAQLNENAALPRTLNAFKDQIKKDAVLIGLWCPTDDDYTEMIYGVRLQ